MLAKATAIPAPQESPPQSGARPARIVSLDALRGLDMLCILGVDRLFRALGDATHLPLFESLGNQMTHVPWAGLHVYDVIFPLFIFIVGVSMVFSLDRILERSGRRAAVAKVLRRSVILFLLGIFYMGGIAGGLRNVYLAGVLQRIAEAYVFAGLIYCYLPRRPRAIAVTSVALLVAYWALLTFVPVPGVGHASYERGQNLAHWIDVHYLPGASVSDPADFEGSLLNTLGAVANCLLGALAGLLLTDERIAPRRKVAWLVGDGEISLGLGYLWGLQFPIVKLLWTSSYVLVTCGYSAILLALFYAVMDIGQRRRWAQPLIWVGMNPITIYLVANMVDFPRLARRLVGGEAFYGAAYAPVVAALGAIGLELLLAWYLYRRKVFLRI